MMASLITTIRVSPEDFSVDAEVARVREASPSAGAVVFYRFTVFFQLRGG